MDKGAWILISSCWAFAGPAEDGGVRRGESTVGSSGSGMDRMCPWRRAWQNEVGK